MFRIKILAVLVSVIVALTEELTWLKAESPAPKVEEKKTMGWPPEQYETAAAPDTARSSTQPTLIVSASVYHAEPNQTDSTPFITADGSRINRKNPGKHRWIAVSRDLHTRWGGPIAYGDSLWVTGLGEGMDGLYVVRDVMNRRIRNRIDVLVSKHTRKRGFWRNVHIAKLD